MTSKANYLGITIDYSRDRDIPEQGLAMLTGKGFYKREHENSPQETLARMATCYSFGDYAFAQRIYEYASRQHFVAASPVQSNAVDIIWPEFREDQFQEAGDWLEANVTPDGLPISCFLSMIADSKEGLVIADAEAKVLSMMGGGVGLYAAQRAPDEKSTGVMAHNKLYDAMCVAYRQSRTRRGSMAVYLDINHPEIRPFLHMRDPSGGLPDQKAFNLNNGLNIPDAFMHAVIKGEQWELVDPKHGPTGRFEDARELFDELMDVRKDTGEPYMLFTDTVNRNLPKQITNPRYVCHQSNLCSEITLRTSVKRTAVCCLSSTNADKYHEWKDTQLIADLVRLLDNVLEYFIRLAPASLKRAIYSARKERALGIGLMGWHSYLQRNNIAFESGGYNSNIQHTNMVHAHMRKQAEAESLRLGALRGVPDDLEGSGHRNSHWFAIAPNASSSSLVNVSPSREPWAGVAFNAQGRAGSYLIKNPHFEALLKRIGKDTPDVWKSIILADGSVQHLEFLSDHEKNVYKTIREINPMWIIEAAAAAQPHICQSQSVNIYVSPTITRQEMTDIHIAAWAKGLKSLYYCRSTSATKAKVGDGGKTPLNSLPVKMKIEFTEETCLSCEG